MQKTTNQLLLALLVGMMIAFLLKSFLQDSTERSILPTSDEDVAVSVPELPEGMECETKAHCRAIYGDMDCQDFQTGSKGQCSANCTWYECQNGACMEITVVAIKNYASDLGRKLEEECTRSSFLKK